MEGVHAKVYVLDEWAYVGSANLTNGGLAPGLREFGRARKGRHKDIAKVYFDAVERARPLPRRELTFRHRPIAGNSRRRGGDPLADARGSREAEAPGAIGRE